MTQSVATSWLVLQMTGRGFDLALLSAATMLPVLCGSAWAGAVVDRIDRRRLLIAGITVAGWRGLTSRAVPEAAG